MTRYIDADALIKGIDIKVEITDRAEADKVANAFCEIISRIKNAPTADVVEVTDKSIIPLVKDFVKDLEKLGGRATCNDIIKSMKR